VRRNFVERTTMDLSNRISRSEIAEQLGVQTQTIAKWERRGRFLPRRSTSPTE